MGYEKTKAAEKRTRGGRRGKPASARQWADVPRELIGEFVRSIVQDGRGCLFGTTSDGGALVVRVYDGGDADTEYIKPSDDIQLALSDIAEDYTGQPLENDLGA